jgi:hypothetical protein
MGNDDFLSSIIKGIFLSCLESEMTFLTSENKVKVVNYDTFEDLMVVEKKHEKCKMKWLVGLQICTIDYNNYNISEQ